MLARHEMPRQYDPPAASHPFQVPDECSRHTRCFIKNAHMPRPILSKLPPCPPFNGPNFLVSCGCNTGRKGVQNRPLGVSGYNRSRGGQADRVFGGTPERISRSSFWDRDFWLPGALFYTVPSQEAIRAGVRGAGARAAFSCFFDNFFEVRPSDF